jgi:hypothetical protein
MTVMSAAPLAPSPLPREINIPQPAPRRLGDGRVAEIRIAAAPEQFEKLAGLMKNAVNTFRLVGRKVNAGNGETMAKTE